MGFRDFLYTESRMTTMYHISPQSGLKSLRPTGHHRGTQAYPQGMAGVYLAPKFADAVAWGVSHVMYKKGRTQSKRRSERLVDSGGGWHDPDLYYQELTIYTVELPQAVVARSWGDNWWEPEIFVPESDMDGLRIVASQTFRTHELQKIYQRSRNIGRPDQITRIQGVSKTNVAAKVYLDYKKRYEDYRLGGGEAVPEIQGLLYKLSRMCTDFGGNPAYQLEKWDNLDFNKAAQRLEILFKGLGR